ncbi:MAG: tetratricopeptide repeat protein [Phycisphaerae bacterium]
MMMSAWVLPLLLVGQTKPIDPPTQTRSKPDPETVANRPISLKPAPKDADPINSETADWLVELARHQGHLVGHSQPRSASLHIMALLKAAIDLSPDCADAYYWLYDLEHRLGREDAARRALGEFIRLTPGDVTARIRHFELELRDLQTSEDRAAYVKQQLTLKDLPAPFESELRAWLARHYFERRENGFAIRESEHALRLNPANVAARELAYDMFGETDPALQRVEMALQLISINPSQANLVWDLAEFLDQLSLHARAQEWYNRAIELHTRANTGPVPAEFWHKLAISYANSGNFQHAKQNAEKALEINPNLHTARLLLANALNELGKPKESAAQIDLVATAYAAREQIVISEKRYDEAARIAWFHCYHRPNPDKAMRFAELAMKDPEPSSLAKVALGYALRLNAQTDEAIKILQPLAAHDQLAAYELARARIERGEKKLAMTTLHKAATTQYSGIAYNLIAQLLKDHGETPPKLPTNTRITDALDKFQRDVFDYHQRPRDFLTFSVKVENEPTPAIGPLNVVFRLENTGPFPITFGEGMMARPLVAVSARVGGKNGKTYPEVVQVLLNTRPMLMPGDSFEKIVSINVGPIRNHLLRTISEPVPVEITAVFDPIYEDDRLKTGMGSIQVGPVKIVRSALDLSPEGLETILGRARSTEIRTRALAAEQIGAILASAGAGLPKAVAGDIPIDTLHAALADLLSDDAWVVQSHALVAAGWFDLDNRVTVAAAPCVRDKKPIVKLLAVRLFAEKQGEAFEKVLKHLSQSDVTDYVRMMAASYLPDEAQAQAGALAEP